MPGAEASVGSRARGALLLGLRSAGFQMSQDKCQPPGDASISAYPVLPRFGDCFEKGEEGRRPQPALGKRTDSEHSHCWKPAEADCAICRPLPWLSCAILQLASRLPGATPSFSFLKAGRDVSWQNEPFLPYSLVSPSCISRPRWDLEVVRRKGSWT